MNRPSLLEWVGVAVVCGSAALAALIELFLVPLYAGSTLVPVAVLLAVVSNVALPLLARALAPATAAMVLPFLAWLVVVLVVGWFTRPEGDVVLPGGGGGPQWVGVLVSFGGALAGMTTLALGAPKPHPRVNR